MKFKRQIIQVALNSEKRVPVNALVCDGLAVHRDESGDPVWCVTHIRSGGAVIMASSHKRARELAEKLLPVLDWHCSEEAVTASEAVRDIRAEYFGQHPDDRSL